MASSSEKAPSPAAADLPERGKITVAGGKPKGKTRRMTQEEIDSYIRYKGVRIPVDSVRRASKLRLALTNLDDLGSLPVSPDDLDDYVTNMIREVNAIEDDFQKERDEIAKEYYAKGYVEREVSDDDEAGASNARVEMGSPSPRTGSTVTVRKLN
ncbi:unnamed protein product [Triticum aestivum]|uniref:Uncharacterized protein n=2 Tax=Triticum aestivum TaxID=4565 RepID=A0A9R1EUY4_WHEAT|nr:uncharacterized protein LOC123049595 [Triticum aestivum]KAF7017286.1 hypothetical protein CFC21_030753 [Triticum aestivum]KAF7017292.1 hypothetical protein CFC21_030758 [Triticum aestivum]SPT19048.1 unnamed protein product [Triticum aestivum]